MTDSEKALQFLKKSEAKGSILGLSRIYELLEFMGNPQEKINVIHVSGTNGKGSFSAMLSSILSKAGYNVGSFSSPSLISPEDSFRLNCNAISKKLFIETLCTVTGFAEKMSDSPTEFEIHTAMAYQLFYNEKCDFAIIECGLGGDTDSTNAISKPFLSVITNVQKDHCHILGNSISEIAQHKAGIIKENCPVLYGGEYGDAFDIISKKAEEMSSKLYLTDKKSLEIMKSDLDGTFFNFENYKNFKLSLLGLYQAENAANVLTAVKAMRDMGADIADNAVIEGLANCVWQGRFEIIKKNPLVIFDGSHNPDGMKYTVESIKEYLPGKKVVMLMGVMADKEYSLYCGMLREVADRIFTVTPKNIRSLDSKSLADCFTESGLNATACKSMEVGIKLAVDYAEKNSLPLFVLGSLYMYKDFSEIINK